MVTTSSGQRIMTPTLRPHTLPRSTPHRYRGLLAVTALNARAAKPRPSRIRRLRYGYQPSNGRSYLSYPSSHQRRCAYHSPDLTGVRRLRTESTSSAHHDKQAPFEDCKLTMRVLDPGTNVLACAQERRHALKPVSVPLYQLSQRADRASDAPL